MGGFEVSFLAHRPGGTVTKSGREIMEILEAYDLTGCAHSAAQLAGTDRKTVARYVALRDAGADPLEAERRSRSVDGFVAKVEELVDRGNGRIRADVVHRKLTAMGYAGSERTTRRAVAEAKAGWRAGHRRAYRPWIPEPGMWLQWDWGEGPRIGGRRTQLFCCWLAWSRFRVVLPSWDQGLGSLTACLDRALRIIGGAPAYLLTDNDKTVTVEHVAGIPVRHPDMVALGRHYGWRLPAGSSATGSMPASTGRAPRCRGSGRPPSGCSCIRCRPSPMCWPSGRYGWSAMIRRSGSGRCGTPPRPAT